MPPRWPINDLLPRTFVTFVSCSAGAGRRLRQRRGPEPHHHICVAGQRTKRDGHDCRFHRQYAAEWRHHHQHRSVSNSSAVDPVPANNSATTSVTVSAPQSATNFIVANSTGSYFGTITLTTTLRGPERRRRSRPHGHIFHQRHCRGHGGDQCFRRCHAWQMSAWSGRCSINAGTYVGALSASFAGDSQFAPSTGSATLTVDKAHLTVTTQTATRVYGDANPAFTYVISGFLNNETVPCGWNSKLQQLQPT